MWSLDVKYRYTVPRATPARVGTVRRGERLVPLVGGDREGGIDDLAPGGLLSGSESPVERDQLCAVTIRPPACWNVH